MVNQKNLIFGRENTTGELKPFNYNRGAMEVYIQDQNTPIINYLAFQDLNSVVLAANTVIDSRQIALQSGHGVLVGNIIQLRQAEKSYQGIVTNVSGNTITFDSPLDKVFYTNQTYTAIRGSANLAVNGSVTRQIFNVRPAQNNKWDITQVIVYIVDDSAMDDTKIGGIAAVSNGIVMRKKNSTYDNIGNIKSNGDLKAVGCDVVYATKVGGGEYSMQGICQFGGQGNAGVVIRIDGTTGEEIQFIVQDDLSAITKITAVVVGHVVE